MDRYMACRGCDALHRVGVLPAGAAARCVRCGAVLYRRKPRSLDHALALAVAGIVLFVMTTAFPFLTMRSGGSSHQISLLDGVSGLWSEGMQPLAALVMATSALFPLTQLVLLVYVLLALRLKLRAPGLGHAYRMVRLLQDWAMIEVFLLGALVAVVKLSDMAEVVLGPAFHALACLILVLAGAFATLDPRAVWYRVKRP